MINSERKADLIAYEKASQIYTAGYILVLCSMWVKKIEEYHSHIGKGDLYSAVTMVVGNIHAPNNSEMTIAFLGLLLASNIRVVFGSMYAHRDSSWKKALNETYSDSQIGSALLAMYTVIKVVALVALLRTYVLDSPNQIIAPACMAIEAAFVVLFDIRFWKVFLNDTDKRGSVAILLNDVVFAFISFAWFILAFVNARTLVSQTPVAVHLAVISATVVYCFIFAVEFFTEYVFAFAASLLTMLSCLVNVLIGREPKCLWRWIQRLEPKVQVPLDTPDRTDGAD
ncbi:hypothetical protein P9281_27505 [Caballeronia sp. LP003]|uniref:hypothetical protein n=1 Tax=Caballeronia sp. LP003 TaxID=3038551 RepID=UPI002855F9C6|nr:hypothetical protein [Caballeronia sp. LP003]MDR5790297.1 hypothetical protein [Caballeronia sp. LP003]